MILSFNVAIAMREKLLYIDQFEENYDYFNNFGLSLMIIKLFSV